MARKKTSGLEDLMDISAQLPWKAGVALALVAYLALHYLASRAPLSMNPVELKAMGKSIGDGVSHSLITTFSSFFQYILPLVFLAGSFVSFKRRQRQGELHGRTAADSSLDALEKMSWREFEGLTAETFRRQGYRVVERGGDGPDGGVDLEMYRDSDKYLVQCKQWKAMKVGVATVRELYGVMAAERAVGGFVVSSGSFTEDAKAFSEGRSIRLIDAKKLRSMIGASTPSAAPAQTSADTAPTCPKCGSPMIQRTAKSGSNAGKTFWGCSTFPACRGVRG